MKRFLSIATVVALILAGTAVLSAQNMTQNGT